MKGYKVKLPKVSELDHWGADIYSGSAQLISFEINCFYGL